jgi:hypothetical protein
MLCVCDLILSNKISVTKSRLARHSQASRALSHPPPAFPPRPAFPGIPASPGIPKPRVHFRIRPRHPRLARHSPASPPRPAFPSLECTFASAPCIPAWPGIPGHLDGALHYRPIPDLRKEGEEPALNRSENRSVRPAPPAAPASRACLLWGQD